LLVGPAVVSARGTPTTYSKRNEANEVSSGALGGFTTTLLVGGALTDWFSFQLGFQSSSAANERLQMSAGGFLVGVEVWPLFARGGLWRDVGLGAHFGSGGATLQPKGSDEKLADSGAFSQARLSVFWDATRLWKINLGPAVAYEFIASPTYTQHVGFLALRAMFYGMPLAPRTRLC